jgi:choline dehydrogenase-like flavoprotein
MHCTAPPAREVVMRKAIVIGTGAGGATAARELQGTYDVLVLEAGGEFHPFTRRFPFVDKLKRLGLLFDEREIQLLFPAMRIRRTTDRMVMVNGRGLGGTTTLATGNGIRVDGALKAIGINLDTEFEELYREIPISMDHQKRWRPATRRLFQICQEMNLHPAPLPKMGESRKCVNCGRCVFGCPYGAKWDSRQFLRAAVEKGARVKTGCTVQSIAIRGQKALGVMAGKAPRSEFIPGDLIVLAAGGLGTPAILENSGISCSRTLFVDPVLCVSARWEQALQNREISMPFVVERSGYILSPYFDYLSYFFNSAWRCPIDDTLSIMVKLADSSNGSVRKKQISKSLTEIDRQQLRDGLEVCAEVFGRLGVKRSETVLGTLNAGHPGGTFPLTREEASTFHSPRLPENLYISDSTLFPSSLGKPPILTIMAMAKRVARICSLN